MPFIQVSKGGPTQDIPDGVYPFTLIGIEGPKTVTAKRGPNAGQDVDLLEWQWACEDANFDGYEISTSSSTNSGPRSKVYAYLTALFGGVAPQVDAGFEKEHLIGRMILGTVQHDDGGWPTIVNVGAMPAQMRQPAPPQPVYQPQAAAVPTDQSAMVQQPAQGRQRAPRQARPMVETATVSDAQGTRPLVPTGAKAGDDLPF